MKEAGWSKDLVIPAVTQADLDFEFVTMAEGQVASATTPAEKRALAAVLAREAPETLAWLVGMGRAFGPAEVVEVGSVAALGPCRE